MSYRHGRQMTIGESWLLLGHGFIWLVAATGLALREAIERARRG